MKGAAKWDGPSKNFSTKSIASTQTERTGKMIKPPPHPLPDVPEEGELRALQTRLAAARAARDRLERAYNQSQAEKKALQAQLAAARQVAADRLQRLKDAKVLGFNS